MASAHGALLLHDCTSENARDRSSTVAYWEGRPEAVILDEDFVNSGFKVFWRMSLAMNPGSLSAEIC